MATNKLIRGTVGITPGIEQAFRERMKADYDGEIPGISESPLALLMRFAILRAAGVDIDTAKRGLKNLPRGVTYREDILT